MLLLYDEFIHQSKKQKTVIDKLLLRHIIQIYDFIALTTFHGG